MPRPKLLGVIACCLVTGVLAGLGAAPARAHTAPVHWIFLTANDDYSSKSTTFTGHFGYQVTVTAYFGQITSGSIFLQSIDFNVFNVNQPPVCGGAAWIQDARYEADSGACYYSAHTYGLGVSSWYGSGIALEKAHTTPACMDSSCTALHMESVGYQVQ